MTSYTCQTCSANSDDSGKHFSSTRHKNVSYDPLDETVECEECGDSNIHILSMLRYGLSDLRLLCGPCYSKSGTSATAEYTLSNGTLLVKLPQYYTYRDIMCEKCGKESDLYVGEIGARQHIMCGGCLDEHASRRKSFVGENEPDFLCALLGIKEHLPKGDSKPKLSKGKSGRKAGRKSEPKKMDAESEKRKSHYENAKATKNALKTGKTIKAVGSGTQSPSSSRPVTPTPQSKPRGKGKNGVIISNDTSSTENRKNTKGNKSRSLKEDDGKSERPKPSATKATPKSKRAPTSSQNKLGSSSPSAPEEGTIAKSQRDKTVHPNATKGDVTKATDADSKDQKEKSSKDSARVQKVSYPAGIFKYNPAATPKLSYDSMNEYFNEMCYNLFLEEKISLGTSPKILLTSNDFVLEWYAEQNRRHKQFKLSMLMTPELLDRFQQKKMQALKRKPFNVGQSIILMLDDDIPWYGNVVYAETERAGKGHGKGRKPKNRSHPRKDDSPQMLELIVELYSWNTMPLPVTCDVRSLRVLPVSVPVSRIFSAMSQISNSKFIDLILGKKPIRQIFFKNYMKFSRDSFNESQRVAMQSVMNNSITVLQGPPGTGKTSTICEIIQQLLDNLNTYPILVVAASNIAIDNIAEKLLPKHKNSILRIVSAEKESEYNREHPLASICLHHKVFDGLPAGLQVLFRELRKPNASVSPTQFKKLMSAQITFSDKIIASSRVFLTTSVVAGGNQLKSLPKMPVVIMDEATQSSEPITLIPLSMKGVEKFVFVGDQRQLSSFSQVPNLSLSLFERILSNGTYNTPHMLDTQYRMHPSISKFPRMQFYDGLLKDGITAEDRFKEGIPSNPILFWDTKGEASEDTVFSRFREDAGLTYCNVGEVDYVQKVLTYLIYEKNIPRSTIGVITPYRGQRDTISSRLVKNELVNPNHSEVQIEVDREDFFSESKPVTIHSVADIMIASVDAFQGREKDFLIMSCVRSNKKSKIGFLSDARRMNVALTRARYGMILIGDVSCLKSADPLWRKYITSLEENNSIFSGTDFSFS